MGKSENADRVFEKINSLYRDAYVRYIDTDALEPDEIDPKDFSKEKVKEVVTALQGMSITKGAALNGDVIGAFFEEILRIGFKQDKGMYFTHSNLVRFMIEVIDLDGLTTKTWNASTHPENRLPYVIDPACGSGTFLLNAMSIITNAINGILQINPSKETRKSAIIYSPHKINITLSINYSLANLCLYKLFCVSFRQILLKCPINPSCHQNVHCTLFHHCVLLFFHPNLQKNIQILKCM